MSYRARSIELFSFEVGVDPPAGVLLSYIIPIEVDDCSRALQLILDRLQLILAGTQIQLQLIPIF